MLAGLSDVKGAAAMSAMGHKRSFPRDFPMVLFKPDDWHRCRPVERPSEVATSSSRRIVNRVRRDPAGSPVKEWIAGVTAGPGEAGWNPVDAHIRRPSCRSPFDPIEGDAPRRGDLLFPGGRAEIPVVAELNLAASVEAGHPHQVAPADLSHGPVTT